MSMEIKLIWDFMDSDFLRNQENCLDSEGEYGYLRAGIQQIEETKLLRAIFDDEILYLNEPIEFDFVGKYKQCSSLCHMYLEGKEMPKYADILENEQYIKRIENYCHLNDISPLMMIKPTYNKYLLVNQIQEFFKLGIRLQCEGAKPRLLIDM